jgi:perosamine synthetase
MPTPSQNQGQPVISVGTVHITDRAKAYVMEVLNQQRLSYGPMTRRLETEFARVHGCRFGVMSNSGTGALQIALQAMKERYEWNDGDEVIVPSVTFVATANIVHHTRMRPVLVDVDPVYYEMDPSLLESKITPRTRAIIPVHLFGQPADMDPLSEVARRHKLKIIEDSCETMFAAYRGRSVGSLGDIACFSTYAAHLLVTGVGGLNTTNDPDFAVRLHSLMNHGRDSIYISIDDDKGKSSEDLRMVIARRFKFISMGHSFRVTEMEAALGVAQLEDREMIVSCRRANARGLTQRLSRWQDRLQLPQIRPGNDHSFMMYPIVLKEQEKEELVNYLERNGVGTRDMLPLTSQPVYHRLFGWREADYPVAQWINRNGFYIGCHQDITESDLDYVAELFEGFFLRRSQQVREGACLVLTACGDKDTLERLLAEVPFELFSRLVAFGSGMASAVVDYLKGRGIEVVAGEPPDLLASLLQRPLAVQQSEIILFPADGRHNPRDIGRLLLSLEHGRDMAVASRFLPGGARHHPQRRFHYRSLGNRLFTFLANLLFIGNLTDSLSVFRGVKRERLKDLNVRERGLTGFYSLSLSAVNQGWKIAEIPTVELLTPRLIDHLRVAASFIPLFYVTLREWWRRRGAPPHAA